MSTVVSLVMGVAFCVVAWRPPASDEAKRATLMNPNGLSWGRPRLLPNATGRIVQALFALFGVGLLVDVIIGVVK